MLEGGVSSTHLKGLKPETKRSYQGGIWKMHKKVAEEQDLGMTKGPLTRSQARSRVCRCSASPEQVPGQEK